MKKILFVPFLALVLSLTGCVAKTVSYQSYPDSQKEIENMDMGRLYVIRSGGTNNAFGVAGLVIIDENEIGEIGDKGFLAVEIKPGKHEVSVDPIALGSKNKTIDIEIKAGTQHFVEARVKTVPFVGIIYSEVDLIDQELGKALLSKSAPGVVKTAEERRKRKKTLQNAN